ncbi:MAG: alginate lyase family protein [Planctomycetes bacterium]|nr:alginate lyase family protein [Planctomycetota bacterium]
MVLSTASGIWLSTSELLNLPTTGPAWDTLSAAAATTTLAPNIQDQDEKTDVLTLAKALVGVRTNNQDYISQVRTNVIAAIGSELGGRTLALGRNLASYVIAADLVGLEPAQEARFQAWLQQTLTEELDGKSLQSTHEIRPNNWGTMAGGSRAAVAVYLGDQAELARTAQVFKGWLGDLKSYAGFEFGTDLSWQADPSHPVGVNPKGTMKDGHSIDGALPDDMRRGGSFTWPPLSTGYPWEAVQGVVVQAEILSRAGYDTWHWQDQAILRAVQFLYGIGWPATGDDQWVPWLIDAHYGTHFASNAQAEPGKIMGWTSWTHQFGVPTTANLAPVVDAGADQNVPLSQSANLDGTVTDDGKPAPAVVTTAWTKISGPGTVTFGNPTTVDTTAAFSAPGVYVLQLQASDGALIGSDRVTITVVDSSQNDAPVVNAGLDQTILTTSSANLDGTVTDDGRPNPPGTVTTVWSKVSGPGRVTFGNAFAVDTTVKFSAAGTYVLKLTANDGSLSTSDTATITVLKPNKAPVVSAGADLNTPALNSISFNGTVTDDDLPNPPAAVTTQWSKVSGPGTVTFADSTAVDTTANFSDPGTYVLRLQASDGALTTEDAITLTAGASTQNQAPVVDAGPDMTVLAQYRDKAQGTDEGDSKDPDRERDDDGDGDEHDIPKGDKESKPKQPKGVANGFLKQKVFVGEVVSLDGTVTDDGLPRNLRTMWTKVSGQGAAAFANPKAVDTTVRFNKPGTYVLRLTATDGLFAGSDDVVISVVAPNLAPVVSAGRDQTVLLGLPVSLRGTVTDDGLPGSPAQLKTSWSVLTGPGTVAFANSLALETTATFSQVGTYQLRLTADDGERIGFQDVKIKVRQPFKIKLPTPKPAGDE